MVAKTVQSWTTYLNDNFFLGQPIGAKPFVDRLFTFEILLVQKQACLTTYVTFPGQPEYDIKFKTWKVCPLSALYATQKSCLATKT